MKPMKYWKNPPLIKLKMLRLAIAEPEISRGNKVAGIVRKIQVIP